MALCKHVMYMSIPCVSFGVTQDGRLVNSVYRGHYITLGSIFLAACTVSDQPRSEMLFIRGEHEYWAWGTTDSKAPLSRLVDTCSTMTRYFFIRGMSSLQRYGMADILHFLYEFYFYRFWFSVNWKQTCQVDNFVVTDGTVSCLNDNLRWHRRRQCCQTDDLLIEA